MSSTVKIKAGDEPEVLMEEAKQVEEEVGDTEKGQDVQDANPVSEDDAVHEEGAPVFDHDHVSRLLASIEHDVHTLRQMIEGIPVEERYTTAEDTYDYSEASPYSMPGFMPPRVSSEEDAGIEGAFDGERMIDGNGKSYQVPPNYASKSKLVEGDPLKLYITHDGKYVYKQLGPVERRTVQGTLHLEGSHYVVDSDEGIRYSVLTACVTYYMALFGVKEGDRVMIMIPADRPARYAVIDNVI